MARDGLGAAASTPAASASKSTCLVKPTSGSPILVRRSSRSCSANRLIRGFIIVVTHSSMADVEILPSQANCGKVFRGRLKSCRSDRRAAGDRPPLPPLKKFHKEIFISFRDIQ